MPALTDRSAPVLRVALPEFVPVSNPVDLTAQGLVDPDLFRRAAAALLGDERFGCIVFAIIQTDEKTCSIKFPPIIDAIRQLGSQKAAIFAGLDEGAAVPETYIAQLRALNIPYFPSPGRAFRAIARVCAAPAPAGNATSRLEAPKSGAPASTLLGLSRPGTLAEYRAKELLKPVGIPFPAGQMVRTVESAMRAASQVGYPVVFKAQSAGLPHKSDAGGVVLNIEDADAIPEAWERLHANIARSRPNLLLDGVLVENMSKPGVELIIGGRNDPDWGPILLAGFGGVHAEILNDVRLMAPDLNIAEITRELYRLKSGELLRGYRGAPELDVGAVAKIIAQIGALLLKEPTLKEIDLNPVIVYQNGGGAIALDALLVTH